MRPHWDYGALELRKLPKRSTFLNRAHYPSRLRSYCSGNPLERHTFTTLRWRCRALPTYSSPDPRARATVRNSGPKLHLPFETAPSHSTLHCGNANSAGRIRFAIQFSTVAWATTVTFTGPWPRSQFWLYVTIAIKHYHINTLVMHLSTSTVISYLRPLRLRGRRHQA